MSTNAGRLLLIAPHPDDIAWSVGGALARARERSAELVVVTVFELTRYAPGSVAHRTSAASGVRAAEDRAWARQVGTRLEGLGLADASLRGFDDITEMGAVPEQAIVRLVISGLVRLSRRVAPDVIFAPQSIGGHVDHRAVRVAVEEVRRRTGIPVAWYEDLPYATEHDALADGEPVVVDVTDHWSAKEAGIRIYASQLPDEVLPAIRDHAERIARESLAGLERTGGPARGERLWVSDDVTRRSVITLLAEG